MYLIETFLFVPVEMKIAFSILINIFILYTCMALYMELLKFYSLRNKWVSGVKLHFLMVVDIF